MFAAWQLGTFSNDAWNVAQARRPNESEEKGGSGRMCVRQREWDWQLLGGFSTGLFLRVLWSSSWDVRHANAIANYATVKPASNTQTHTAAPQRQQTGQSKHNRPFLHHYHLKLMLVYLQSFSDTTPWKVQWRYHFLLYGKQWFAVF